MTDVVRRVLYRWVGYLHWDVGIAILDSDWVMGYMIRGALGCHVRISIVCNSMNT